MKRLVYSITLILYFFNVSTAQVNVETFRSTANKEGFFGSLAGGLQIQSGNVDIKIYNIDASIHIKSNKNHIFLKASMQKGYQNEILFQNSGFSHLRYTIMQHNILGYEAFTQTEYNTFKALNIRHLVGVGSRFEYSTKNKLMISAGLGLMHDYEQISFDNDTIVQKDFRINSYFVLSKNINQKSGSLFSVVIYYQPLIFNHIDWRIKNEANLKSYVGSVSETKFYVISSFTYLYDSKPPKDVVTDDRVLKFTLNFEW